MIDFTKSIIESYCFHNTEFLIKRDDLISPTINGNKAYKFYFLLEKEFDRIISYGGNQSNAMTALSFIAHYKKAEFIYITKPLSSYLANHIDGNLRIALDNGMRLHFETNLAEEAKALYKKDSNNSIFISQGGMCEGAKIGIMKLAEAIFALNLNDLCVFYASGTGTSALYLQLCLNYLSRNTRKISVVTTPSVGDEIYLREQFSNVTKHTKYYPTIILSHSKIPFATPHKEIIDIYKQWLNIGVEFDLIYDCLLWRAILDNIDVLKTHYKHFLFLHSGGISGNITQLKRYRYTGIL